ncbi:hypothetical protein GPECTOR_355g114 [Gonium pectorale]|uniref:Uncharacterized protein n=1 Tax=Gonium pectorale TaxID=33097 RepID=A0A150FVI8_GONPE|nr:hypothetical protein GPECTOR_355g114 [Gonium pectorale]|eukprot:KXZ41624.1 hypothetical protein GPECTOR_355g114 [Gonium pectorale]
MASYGEKTEKAGAEGDFGGVQVHRIRITLTSKNVKNLEKGFSFFRNKAGVARASARLRAPLSAVWLQAALPAVAFFLLLLQLLTNLKVKGPVRMPTKVGHPAGRRC